MGEPMEGERFGKKVNVDVNDVVTYGQEMMKLAGEAVPAGANAMSEMPMLINQALNTPLDGEVLPEGQQLARFLNNRMIEFQYFFRDVGDGLMNIGNAAIVVAEIYEGADNENGATLDDIGFVFGDPGARPPDGFRRDYETVDDWMAKQAEQSGQNVQALTGDERFADAISYPYGTIYTFGDGSRKQIHSSTRYENGQTIYVTTTTITSPDGKVISTETRERYTNSSYQTVREVRTTENDGRTASSDTNYNDDGSITVSTKTGDEKPVVNTYERDDHRENEVETPVADAAEDLDTHGPSGAVENYGFAR